MSKPAFHDVGFNLLRRAETRESHDTVQMRLVVDRGPILMYACYASEKCGNVAYVYDPRDPAPTCSGGMHWSFKTVDLEDE